MVLVRRKPAPADPRIVEMRQRTEKQLANTDAETLATGAWFAGFYPDWPLTDKLLPLLRHERWEVRRAAAEALGRRGDAAGDAILAAYRKESDAHVQGDQLVALARLGHAEVPALCGDALKHKQAWLRRQAIRAASLWKAPNELAAHLLKVRAAESGLHDADLRVRRTAIELLPEDAAPRVIIDALAATVEDQPIWADVVARNQETVAEYRKQAFQWGNGLLLAVAARRADPELAAALVVRLDKLDPADAAAFTRAALTQRDPALTRRLFERREKVPPVVAGHLTLLLEMTFGARLGNNLGDWEGWLRDNRK
jgi:hypothetical protein